MTCIYIGPADSTEGSPSLFWSPAYFCSPDISDSASLKLSLHKLCTWEGSAFKIRIDIENSDFQVALPESSASR